MCFVDLLRTTQHYKSAIRFCRISLATTQTARAFGVIHPAGVTFVAAPQTRAWHAQPFVNAERNASNLDGFIKDWRAEFGDRRRYRHPR